MQLADALRVSGMRVTQGLLLGGLVGVALGMAVGLSRWVEATVDPPMQMLRALPHLGLIPLFILWFGIGELPKVLLVALGVSFPLYLNTFSAIRQVDPKLFETAQVLGFSFWQRLRTIIVPSAAPQVLVGLRQSLAIAWLTLIVAEQINADKGIGFLINNATGLPADRHHHLRPDRLRAAGHRHRRGRAGLRTAGPEVPVMTVTSERQTGIAGELRHVDKWYGANHVLA